MEDRDFAAEVVRRLNDLLTTPEVRADLGRLLETRIPVGPETGDHPAIQVTEDCQLGILGLLNGLCGTRPNGNGFVAAVFDGQGLLQSFELLGYFPKGQPGNPLEPLEVPACLKFLPQGVEDPPRMLRVLGGPWLAFEADAHRRFILADFMVTQFKSPPPGAIGEPIEAEQFLLAVHKSLVEHGQEVTKARLRLAAEPQDCN